MITGLTDNRIERALSYLKSTDASHAEARSQVDYLELKKKTIEAAAFLDAPEGTVAEKQAYVYTTQAYKDHCEEYKQAVLEYQRITNERNREIQVIEVWRTVNANQRKGNI